MKFNELLNQYINTLGCSAKELAVKSGLSPSVISRYRAGERVPFVGSEQLVSLAKGLCLIAEEKNIPSPAVDELVNNLSSTLSNYKIDFQAFIKKLNMIIKVLDINLTELAKSMNFDVSFVSKIRAGQRKPANIEKFIDNICSYITHHYRTQADKLLISEVLFCSPSALEQDHYFMSLKHWFLSKHKENGTFFSELLSLFNNFDVEEYLRDIEVADLGTLDVKNDELIAKDYYGHHNMWRAFQDFFNLTLSSDSKEPIFISADFPFNKIADETMGSGTFMSILLSCINKGIKINILHDLNKPDKVKASSLKAWIPLYMTGMVFPYYLHTPTSTVFKNATCISGVASLQGECIGNDLDDGKIYVTNYPEEINYYKRRADAILRKAEPLIEVYTDKQKNIFISMLESDSMTSGKRRNILPSLPIYTMPEDLLLKILERNNIPDAEKAELLFFTKKHRMIFERIVEANELNDILYIPTEDLFDVEKPAVSLLGAFYNKQIHYTYDEFMEHLEATRKCEKKYKNYTLSYRGKGLLKNIKIAIHDDKWVIISKNNAPIVHFIIRHPGYRDVLTSYLSSITEK